MVVSTTRKVSVADSQIQKAIRRARRTQPVILVEPEWVLNNLVINRRKQRHKLAYRGILEEEESRWKVGEVGDCMFWVSLCHGEENTRKQCPKQDSRPVHRCHGVDVVDDDVGGSCLRELCKLAARACTS